MRSFQSVFVLTVLCVVSAFGQKPDFTGTWKQVGLSDRVRIDKIDHKDPYLKVAAESSGPSAGLFLDHDFRTDGTEQVDNNVSGRQRWRTASWQGSALVILTVIKDGYHVSVTRESWTVSGEGKTLTKTTRNINMDGVTEKTLTFQKE
jgi:hypothetical protein